MKTILIKTSLTAWICKVKPQDTKYFEICLHIYKQNFPQISHGAETIVVAIKRFSVVRFKVTS